MRYATLCSNLTFIILIILLFAGCGGDSGFVDFQLNLNKADVQGKKVTVNGGVMAQVERIQWEWGDGQIVKHRFFSCKPYLCDTWKVRNKGNRI